MFSVRFHFLLWTTVTVCAKEPLYGKIGDKVVLTPDSVVNPVNSIEWKHGLDIAMDWYGDEIFSYRHFKDRGMLNTLTGALTITGLTRNDSGSYTAEINDKVASKTELLVISPVPKPTVSVRCEPEMTYCVLTCSGSTTGAEPVTYRWTSGDITLSSTKEHKITKENKEPWFSCAFENPVSFNSSEKVPNPFINKEPLYMEIGDEAVLTPDSVANRITSIVWTYGPDIAMDWYGDEISAYRHFKDRGTLNTLTGALTITGLTRDDSGNYTVEINDKVASKTELLVISPVSKPTVSDWCEPEMTYCVLTCSGSTTGAEPVTYRWTSDDITWSSTKEHKITKENKESWFSCTLENPVSFEISEKVSNPFLKWDLIWTFIFISVFHLVGFIIIIIIIYFRRKAIFYFRRKAIFYFRRKAIIYFKYKRSEQDLAYIFILLIPVVGLIPVLCFIIWIIYNVMEEFLERRRKGEAIEKKWEEFLEWSRDEGLEKWMKGEAFEKKWEEFLEWSRDEILERRRKGKAVDGTEEEWLEKWMKEMTEKLPPDQNTSTQDPTSVVTKDPSNGTEKSADCSRTCRPLTDEQTTDPEDEAQS